MGMGPIIEMLFHRAFPDVSLPSGAHYDILSPFDVVIPHNYYVPIRTGLIAEVPDGFQLQIHSRYSLSKNQIIVMNAPAPIHAGSRDELVVVLENRSVIDFKIKEGDAIAQLALVVVTPFRAMFAESETTTLFENADTHG
jgi:dUTPase